MAFLVRKISRAKWPEEMCDVVDLQSDAISDLRTTGNTLSLWRIEEESDLPNAALALSASSKSNKIENVSVVWISEELIDQQRIKIDENSEGDTVVSDLSNTHRDLCELTYKSLGDFAKILMKELIEKRRYKRYSKGEIKKALVKAYTENRIAEEKCTSELLAEIQKEMQKAAEQKN